MRSAVVAESENVYVKIGQDGQYIERTAGPREIDHINLRALGFVLKGSKGAPKPSQGEVPPPADSNEAPTSVRAAAEAAEDPKKKS
jgi:hypothetical protein